MAHTDSGKQVASIVTVLAILTLTFSGIADHTLRGQYGGTMGGSGGMMGGSMGGTMGGMMGGSMGGTMGGQTQAPFDPLSAKEVRCWEEAETGNTEWNYIKKSATGSTWSITVKFKCEDDGPPIPGTTSGGGNTHAAAAESVSSTAKEAVVSSAATISSISHEPTVKELKAQKEEGKKKLMLKKDSQTEKKMDKKGNKTEKKVKKGKKAKSKK